MSEQQGPKKRHYLAHAELHARLEPPEPGDTLERPVVVFGERRVRLYPSGSARTFLETHEGNDPLGLLIYPRTLKGSYLAEGSVLARVSELKPTSLPPMVQVTGVLEHIDRDEGYVIVEVHPNPKSNLAASMVLDVCVSLELMEKLPKKGAGVQLSGVVKPTTGRLVAEKVKAVALADSLWDVLERKKAEANGKQAA